MIEWLLDKENRDLVSWLGGSVLAVIGSVWKGYTWVQERKTAVERPPSSSTPSPKEPSPASSTAGEEIVQQLFTNLSKPNPVPQMVIIHHGVNRLSYINQIKNTAREYYRPQNFYHLALPVYDMPLEAYFQEIATLFGSHETERYKLQREIIREIEGNKEKIFLLITDFENDTHLLDFAHFMRSILDVVGGKLCVVTIGGEKLASLKTHAGIHSYFNYFHLIPITEGVV
jgi:hypothetical protein